MSEVKDKLITAENLKNAYDDNKMAISQLRGDLDENICIKKINGSGYLSIYNPSTKLLNFSCDENTTFTISNGNLANVSKWNSTGQYRCNATIENGVLTINSIDADAYLDTLNSLMGFEVMPNTEYSFIINRTFLSDLRTGSECYLAEYDANGNRIGEFQYFTTTTDRKIYTFTTNSATSKVALRVSLESANSSCEFRIVLTRGHDLIPFSQYEKIKINDIQDIFNIDLYKDYTLIESDSSSATMYAAYGVSAKNKITYSTPEEFGAVGDGVTDDTIPVLTALNNSNYVVLNKNYRVTQNIEINDSKYISGFGKIILSDSSILIEELQRNSFAIKDITIEVTHGSSESAIKISHCFDITIDNLKIITDKEFNVEEWKGIEIYADENTGGTSFVKVSNILIRGAGTGIRIYCDSISHVTSCHFSNVVIERFSHKGIDIVGIKSYALTFDGVTIDDNFDSGYDKKGINLEYVSGVYFNNMIIWADNRKSGHYFYPLYIIDMSTYILPNKFFGYVEGFIEEHTMSMLEHCIYNFFYQNVNFSDGASENIGTISNN